MKGINKMKCFNHEEREAVATCQRCGKALCKECASKYTPCLCDGCYNAIQREKQIQAQNAENARKQKYIDSLVDTKEEFKETCMLGIGINVIIIVVAVLTALFSGDSIFEYAIGMLTYAPFMFAIPFGWKLFSYSQSQEYFPLFILANPLSYVVWLCVKIGLSAVFGIPAFIYQAIKTLRVQKQINKVK